LTSKEKTSGFFDDSFFKNRDFELRFDEALFFYLRKNLSDTEIVDDCLSCTNAGEKEAYQ
jgi:hypothetical protein